MAQSALTDPVITGKHIALDELAVHLENCLRETDPGLLAAALGRMARAKGVTQLSRDTGIRRTTLYRVLSIDADPSFSAILKVARALGFRLRFEVLPVRTDGTNEQR